MLFVVLSICCFVIVLVLLKLAKRYHIDVLQAITWNYSMVILLTWLVFKPRLSADILSSALSNYRYLLVGLLLPVMFLLIRSCIQATGIILTVVANRLSLIVPLAVSFLWFNEKLNHTKLLGIALSVIAILCSIPWRKARGAKRSTNAWFYLLAVFVGVGLIEVLMSHINLITTIPNSSSLLILSILAFVFSLVLMVIQIIRKKTRFSVPHVLIGWVLGVANFGRVLFYLKGVKALSTQPSGFFLAINIGLITLGTLVALLGFNEKLSNINKVGIFIALVAIIVLSNKFINAI